MAKPRKPRPWVTSSAQDEPELPTSFPSQRGTSSDAPGPEQPTTNVPPEKTVDMSSTTVWGLVRHVLSEDFVVPLRRVWLLLVVVETIWIFVQDNSAGRLEDWWSVGWALTKCSVVAAVAALLFVLYHVALSKRRQA